MRWRIVLRRKRRAKPRAKRENAVTDAAIAEAKARLQDRPEHFQWQFHRPDYRRARPARKRRSSSRPCNNQPVTDALARKLFGLADDVPLSKETMKAVRSDAAAKGYEPVRQAPAMETDSTFRAAIDKLTSRADNASKDFGDLVKSDIQAVCRRI
jgi:hypothetical protein